MGSVRDSELAILRLELNQRRLTPLGTEAKCIHLRSWVPSLEDELADLT